MNRQDPAVGLKAGLPAAGAMALPASCLPNLVSLGGSLAIYYFSPWLPLAALGAMLFLVLAWRRLDLALLYVVFTAPFFRYPKRLDLDDLGPLADLLNRTSAVSFSLVEFALLACLAAWVLRWLLPPPGATPRASVLRSQPLLGLLPPAAVMGAGIISLAASDYVHFSLRELRTVILEPAIFYILVIDAMRDRAAIWRCLDILVGLGLLVSVIGIAHYLFAGVAEEAEGVRRILAVYHSPNHMGLFLGRMTPPAAVITFGLGFRGGRLRLGLYALASAAMLIALFLTYSRGAWLATGGALLFAALLRGRRKHVLLAFAVVAALALAFALMPATRLASNATFQGRWYIWQAAWNMISDRPVWGLGLDNFLYHYPRYMLPEAWREPDVSHAHNVFLDFWSRMGLPGLLAFLAIQARFWRLGVRAYKRWTRSGDDLQWPALALLSSMTAFLLHGVLDNSFFLIDLAFLFWLTLALATVMASGSNNKEDVQMSRKPVEGQER